MKFSVWAPQAKSIEWVSGGRRVPFSAGANGYWSADIADHDPAQGYRYSIDGAEPTPDPRSRWQPDGPHGASHSVDVGAMRPEAFTPVALKDAVIYELHVGTFTPQGTYAAARDKVDYLADLGVTHVELLPLATFPGERGWGYDGVALYAPHPAYGTPQDLAGFVAACHARGVSVLLDVVYNHLGPDGNYLGAYGPYFTDKYKTGWGSAINYDDRQSDAVRAFIIDNALMWLRDYGFDGLRLDAVHAIFSFDAQHVLEELALAVRKLGTELGKHLVLIAESDLNDPRLVHSRARGGLGLDAHWEDDFHHALHRFFTGETAGYYADFNGLADLAKALRDGYVYQGQHSEFRERRHGRKPVFVTTDQLIVCSQNHDQIGNRAQGERLSMMVEPWKLKAIAALTLLSPFVPMLFQGEEWGADTPFLYFTDHQDKELGRLVSEGRAREFSSFKWQGAVPDPQDAETFLKSKLDWSQPAGGAHAQLLEWHRELLRIRHDKNRRRASSAKAPKAVVSVGQKAQWLRFVHEGVLAVFNFADRAQRVPMPEGEWHLVLNSVEASPGNGPMPAQSVQIFRKPQPG
jgi:maltooligosyltrehalose trehalohydrolase